MGRGTGTFAVLFCCALLLSSTRQAIGGGGGPAFSIDSASPSNTGGITPGGVLAAGPAVRLSASSLGLRDNYAQGDYDNLNALSYGRDPIANPLYFSVYRLAIGLPGSAVNADSGAVDVGRHVYVAQPSGFTNQRVIHGDALGLAPGFFGDDMDALDLDPPAAGGNVYFTIDSFSSSNTGSMANDIFLNNISNVFASGESTMGLLAEDAVDGLVLFDAGVIGQLDPGIDKALFSLSIFSPSTFTFTGSSYVAGAPGALSPSDVLYTDFTGGFSLWASAQQMGLFADDELDALDTVVPEPSAAGAALITLAMLAVCPRARRRSE